MAAVACSKKNQEIRVVPHELVTHLAFNGVIVGAEVFMGTPTVAVNSGSLLIGTKENVVVVIAWQKRHISEVIYCISTVLNNQPGTWCHSIRGVVDTVGSLIACNRSPDMGASYPQIQNPGRQ